MDVRETVGRGLQAGPHDVQRRGVQRHAGNGRPGGVVPARAALARPEGQHREAVAVRRHPAQVPLDPLLVGQAQRVVHPSVDVPAVAQSAAHQDPAAVRPVTPQPFGDRELRGRPHDPHGTGSAHHQGDTVLVHATAADVVAGAVADGRIPGCPGQDGPAGGEFVLQAPYRFVHIAYGCQLVPFNRQRGQRLVVPVASVRVEQPGAGSHGHAAGRRAEPFQEEVLADGHPAFHPGERIGIAPGEPEDLGRQIGRVEHTARAHVRRTDVEAFHQFGDDRPRPRVGPADQRGHGAVSLHAHDVVPERGHGHAGDRGGSTCGMSARSRSVPGASGCAMSARRRATPVVPIPGAEVVEHRTHHRHHTVRVDMDTAVRRGRHVVGFLKDGGCDPGRPVEEDRPHGRRADVDGQNAGRLNRVAGRLYRVAGHGRCLTSGSMVIPRPGAVRNGQDHRTRSGERETAAGGIISSGGSCYKPKATGQERIDRRASDAFFTDPRFQHMLKARMKYTGRGATAKDAFQTE